MAELETIGSPGGELRMLMAGPKDTRMMVVYGYARLVGYTPSLEIRAGHPQIGRCRGQSGIYLAFAQGAQMVGRAALYLGGFPLLVRGRGAEQLTCRRRACRCRCCRRARGREFEVLDETTVRYTWAHAEPALSAGSRRAEPALHLSRRLIISSNSTRNMPKKRRWRLWSSKAKQRNWAALHNKLDTMYRNDNPDLPSLEPWMLKTKPPAERFIFERNPYYYRVDKEGHQLPYIDRVILSIADSKIIPAKTGAGESDLQARYLRFDNYTFLKASEQRNDYKVRLWRTGPGSQLALYPNLNVTDEVWRGLVRDVRFRRALSLAVDRHEINQVIYFGLAIEGQNTVLPQSPLYRAPSTVTAWAQFDLDEANRLLDRDRARQARRRRHAPAARRAADRDHRREFGRIDRAIGRARADPRFLAARRDQAVRQAVAADLVPRRVFSGETMMSIDKGIENGLATAAMSPWEFAPTSQQQLEWPKWGQYHRDQGHGGRGARSARRQSG